MEKKLYLGLFVLVAVIIMGLVYKPIVSSLVHHKIQVSKDELKKEQKELQSVAEHYFTEMEKARLEIIDQKDPEINSDNIQKYEAFFRKTGYLIQKCQKKIERIRAIEQVIAQMDLNLGNSQGVMEKIEAVKPMEAITINLNPEDLKPLDEVWRDIEKMDAQKMKGKI